MGKLKLMTIIGTRPEIIRLSATIKCCDRYFEQILVHTGQNYDYTLNQVFFDDLGLRMPDYYLDAVGDDLGATIGNIIEKSYKLMVQVRPDAVLVLGDTNSCLSVIGAKRLHIPIFHMEAGNRCKDECLPEETNRRIVDIISDVNLCYSEHARRYLMECGLPKERTFVTGSPMAEVLHANLDKIEAKRYPPAAGTDQGTVHSALRTPGGEHRYRPQFCPAVHSGQRHGGKVRHADPLLLPSEKQKAAGGDGLPSGQPRDRT
jgi:UDP-N-acetylglucosamine 2-epimerase (non-hydrolysing)